MKYTVTFLSATAFIAGYSVAVFLYQPKIEYRVEYKDMLYCEHDRYKDLDEYHSAMPIDDVFIDIGKEVVVYVRCE